MGQKMYIYRNTILVYSFTYQGEDNEEMLKQMKKDWDSYIKEKDEELGKGNWTCDCRRIKDEEPTTKI